MQPSVQPSPSIPRALPFPDLELKPFPESSKIPFPASFSRPSVSLLFLVALPPCRAKGTSEDNTESWTPLVASVHPCQPTHTSLFFPVVNFLVSIYLLVIQG